MRKVTGQYAVVLSCFDPQNKKKIYSSFIEMIGSRKVCVDFFKEKYREDNRWNCRRIFKLEDISNTIKIKKGEK